MVVAVHNPANLDMSIVEVKVSHPFFKTQAFDGSEWVDIESSVICND